MSELEQVPYERGKKKVEKTFDEYKILHLLNVENVEGVSEAMANIATALYLMETKSTQNTVTILRSLIILFYDENTNTLFLPYEYMPKLMEHSGESKSLIVKKIHTLKKQGVIIDRKTKKRRGTWFIKYFGNLLRAKHPYGTVVITTIIDCGKGNSSLYIKKELEETTKRISQWSENNPVRKSQSEEVAINIETITSIQK